MHSPKAPITYSAEQRAFTGAERLVQFEMHQGLLIENAIPADWTFIDYSPRLAKTGSWEATHSL